MITFILVLIYAFVLYLSYYYVKRNEDYDTFMTVLVSFTDSIVISILLFFSVINGFAFNVTSLIISFFLALILMYFRLKNEDDHNGSPEFRYEGIKNTFLLFVTLVSPFFLFMTTFRYLPFFIQVPLSGGLAYLIYIGAPHVRKFLGSIYTDLMWKVRTDGIRKFAYIWGMMAIIVLTIFAFNLPKHDINNLFNYNNHRPYFKHNYGYPTDLNVNFESTLLEEIEGIQSVDFDYTYELYDKPITDDFDISKYNKFFDTENNITYEAFVANFHTTRYIKTYEDGSSEVYEVLGVHNTKGYVIDGTVYLIGGSKIEIMKDEFKINGLHNLQPKISFYAGNAYTDFDILGAKEVDGKLEFTTIEFRDNVRYYNTYQLEEKDVDLDLPFYSHYNAGFFVFIFCMMLFPITDYRKHVTVVDINSQYGIQKDEIK